MNRLLRSVFNKAFKVKKYYQTFTFYIPAPPKRKNGYREKEFDKFFFQFMEKHNYTLEKITTEAHSEGIWVICLVSTEDKRENKLDLNFPENTSEAVPGISILEEHLD